MITLITGIVIGLVASSFTAQLWQELKLTVKVCNATRSYAAKRFETFKQRESQHNEILSANFYLAGRVQELTDQVKSLSPKQENTPQ